MGDDRNRKPAKLHENAVCYETAVGTDRGENGRLKRKSLGIYLCEKLTGIGTQKQGAFMQEPRGGYGVNLTRYEQEVVINLNADEDTATVYTANPSWTRKMDALVRKFPDDFRQTRQTEISKTYEIPKKYVRIGKPRD